MLFLTSRFFFIHSCEILVIAGDNFIFYLAKIERMYYNMEKRTNVR